MCLPMKRDYKYNAILLLLTKRMWVWEAGQGKLGTLVCPSVTVPSEVLR